MSLMHSFLFSFQKLVNGQWELRQSNALKLANQSVRCIRYKHKPYYNFKLLHGSELWVPVRSPYIVNLAKNVFLSCSPRLSPSISFAIHRLFLHSKDSSKGIDLLRPDKPEVKRFVEVLDSLNLCQVVTKTTKKPISTTSSKIYQGLSHTSTQMFCPAPLSMSETHRILT